MDIEDPGTLAYLSLEWACAAVWKYFSFSFFCFMGVLIALFCSGLFCMDEYLFFFLF